MVFQQTEGPRNDGVIPNSALLWLDPAGESITLGIPITRGWKTREGLSRVMSMSTRTGRDARAQFAKSRAEERL